MEDFASKLRGLDFAFKKLMQLLQSDKTMAAMLKQRDAILNPEDDTLMLRAANEIESLRQQLAEETAKVIFCEGRMIRLEAKIADLTARLEAQEASEAVAVVRFAGVDKIDRKVLQVNADMLDTLPVGTEVFATPQPTKQEASEPVCWITPDGVGWRMRFEPPVNDVPLGWTPLYETPQPTPNVQAAVASAYRKVAEVCDAFIQSNIQSKDGSNEMATAYDQVKQNVLALPHSDETLREICNAIIEETLDTIGWAAQVKNNEIVNRVLGEKK